MLLFYCIVRETHPLEFTMISNIKMSVYKFQALYMVKLMSNWIWQVCPDTKSDTRLIKYGKDYVSNIE